MKKFGDYVFDEQQIRLLHQGQEINAEPKVLELLALFINQPDNIISRQDILDAIWPNSLVTDNAINKLIANLRKLLGDEVKNPRYIQTIPKRGYRLIPEVVPYTDSTVNLSPKAELNIEQNTQVKAAELAEPTNKSHQTLKVFAFLFVLLVIVIWQMFNSKEQANKSYYSIPLTRAHGAEQSAHIHPDKVTLYYLKQQSGRAQSQLWKKDIKRGQTQQIDTGQYNIQQIIGLDIDDSTQTTQLLFLAQLSEQCAVYRATLKDTTIENTVDKLFDCSNKRIKDMAYHAKRQIIYYAAQPKNLWPNQIYAYDLINKKHQLVTQVEPQGWGHHSLDISPDGNKLLIMSTKSDHKTQLLSLNLNNNTIAEGIKFDYPVVEAIWHHDSEQIYYFGPAPTEKIIKSDFDGQNATTVINVSENLASKMTLFPDGEHIVFSTEQKNWSNRWLSSEQQLTSIIDNSRVNDTTPALFHHQAKYFFVSARSSHQQIYLASERDKQAKIATQFNQTLSINHVSLSHDDTKVLINIENKVYLVPVSRLSPASPVLEFKESELIYTSKSPIIATDWLGQNAIAITAVENGTPKLIAIDESSRKVIPMGNRWAYGLSDATEQNVIYLIEQESHLLYRAKLAEQDFSLYEFAQLANTTLRLPKLFFHAKIDNNVLYYGVPENNKTVLKAVSIKGNTQKERFELLDVLSYDVSNGKIMVSDIESLEGDVHRTMN